MGEWIRWSGGECPVPGYVIVEIKLRNGRQYGPKRAHRVDWKHREAVPEMDTIAYRVVQEP